MFLGQTPFLEHYAGYPAMPTPSVRPDDPLLDPLVLGVLTSALEDASVDAYRHGFRDGLRAAALTPTDLEDPSSTWAEGAEELGEGDWQR